MPSDKPARVRYAPSPTGAPHVGNIRTALFNWLYARHTGGQFIVRVEDTDQAREVPNGLELILESLRWLGLDWDEGPDIGGPYGPYRQSERLPIYQEYARRLLDSGAAYLCYCSEERLERLRAEQQARQQPTGYDRQCRNLTPAERAEHEQQGIVPVVRLQVPLEGQTRFHDFIRGDIVFDNATIDDQVLLKSDGFPTYHLAVVVDDHLMHITHIMRDEGWIPSVPKHILLFQAFGWEPPLMGHMPIVLGPDRKRLAKRHGATSTLEFRELGYLPEAMVNFLALVGWAYDDKTEIFTRDELIRYFTLEKVGVTAGIFDHAKLDWMNGYYVRHLSPDDLAARALPYLERDLGHLNDTQRVMVGAIMPAVQERIKRLSEVTSLVDFLFADDLSYDPALLLIKGLPPAETRRALSEVQRTLAALSAWDAPALEAALRPLADELGLKAGQLFGSIRVAVTGKTVTPPLFETMAVLGRDKTLARIEKALAKLI